MLENQLSPAVVVGSATQRHPGFGHNPAEAYEGQHSRTVAIAILNRSSTRRRLAAAGVAALVVALVVLLSRETGFATAAEAKDAAVAAGADCPVWDIDEPVSELHDGIAWCKGPDDRISATTNFITVHRNATERDWYALYLSDVYGGSTVLMGDNWVYKGGDAPSIQLDLGGQLGSELQTNSR